MLEKIRQNKNIRHHAAQRRLGDFCAIKKMFKHIKSTEVKVEDLEVLSVQRLLKDNNDISIAKIQVKGDLSITCNKVSDIYYYVLEGEGVIHLKNKKIMVKIDLFVKL